ncbi:MAG: hypothetical protein WD069_07725 [Planctomycetales bacterium]
MEKTVRSIALVRHPDADPPRWLVRRDAESGALGLLVSDRLEGDSYRECLVREVAWTLGLARDRDFIVSSVPRVHLELRKAEQPELEEDWLFAEFFAVELFGGRALEVVDADPANVWLTAEELRAGETASARLNDRDRLLLARGDVLPAWEA